MTVCFWRAIQDLQVHPLGMEAPYFKKKKEKTNLTHLASGFNQAATWNLILIPNVDE